MRWQEALVLTVVAALASVVSAEVTDTFDGGEWSDQQVLQGSNGWEHCCGLTGTDFVQNGIGFLGTRGVDKGVNDQGQYLFIKALQTPIISGTYVAKAMINVASATRADAGVGAYFDDGNYVEAIVHNDFDTVLVTRVGGVQSEFQGGGGLGGLGWFELQVVYDLDSDSASASALDVDDNTGAIIGSVIDLGTFAGSPNFDVTHFIGQAGNASRPGTGNSGIIDNIGLGRIPEPASLALLALGGLTFLRRRRAA
jgi:hypothetical protein